MKSRSPDVRGALGPRRGFSQDPVDPDIPAEPRLRHDNAAAVTENGEVWLEGGEIAAPARPGMGAIRPATSSLGGEPVHVLQHQPGVSPTILKHLVRRADWPTGGGGKVVEELFLANDPDTGLRDVWFRNAEQVVNLKIRKLLASKHPAAVLRAGDPLSGVPDENFQRVKWGVRDNSFLVMTNWHAFHVFTVRRKVDVPIGSAAVRIALQRYERPLDEAIVLANLSATHSVTGKNLYFTANGDLGTYANGVELPISFNASISGPLVLRPWMIDGFPEPPDGIINDAHLDDDLNLVLVISLNVDNSVSDGRNTDLTETHTASDIVMEFSSAELPPGAFGWRHLTIVGTADVMERGGESPLSGFFPVRSSVFGKLWGSHVFVIKVNTLDPLAPVKDVLFRTCAISASWSLTEVVRTFQRMGTQAGTFQVFNNSPMSDNGWITVLSGDINERWNLMSVTQPGSVQAELNLGDVVLFHGFGGVAFYDAITSANLFKRPQVTLFTQNVINIDLFSLLPTPVEISATTPIDENVVLGNSFVTRPAVHIIGRLIDKVTTPTYNFGAVYVPRRRDLKTKKIPPGVVLLKVAQSEITSITVVDAPPPGSGWDGIPGPWTFKFFLETGFTSEGLAHARQDAALSIGWIETPVPTAVGSSPAKPTFGAQGWSVVLHAEGSYAFTVLGSVTTAQHAMYLSIFAVKPEQTSVVRVRVASLSFAASAFTGSVVTVLEGSLVSPDPNSVPFSLDPATRAFVGLSLQLLHPDFVYYPSDADKVRGRNFLLAWKKPFGAVIPSDQAKFATTGGWPVVPALSALASLKKLPAGVVPVPETVISSTHNKGWDIAQNVFDNGGPSYSVANSQPILGSTGWYAKDK